MKLKSILICLFILCGLALQAQTISVKSFRALPMDMTASSLEGKRIDQNGEVAALIRVVTPEKGFVFEGGTLGIVDTKQKVGEIWVWVPRGARKISIMHQQLGVLREYRYPLEIESERTYEMVLTTGKVETIVKQEVTQQYLAFRISPANAVLEVEGELWEVASDGSAMKFVNFGTYNYRVQAPNYHTEVGKVTVNDPENTQIVPITLKPDFVEVTLKVDADAEIWVNNEKKGTRTWTGNLGKGNYKIECKQAGHETSMIAKEISADLNGQTINLPKPTPLYGSLNIESTPNFATIYIDRKLVGETPKYIFEILVGQHEVKLIKDDYSDYDVTVTINKGEQKTVQATMAKGQTMPIVQTQASSKENVPEGAINGLFSVSPTKKVYFSKGNLQYQASTKTWRFAETQWERRLYDNREISSSYCGWIDLFGWGTSGWNCGNTYYQPWSSNDQEGAKYGPKGSKNLTGSFSKSDWGVYNKIKNGGNVVGQWRTLTKEEWMYVFEERSTTSGIRYARAVVNDVFGMILLPDNWDESIYTLKKTNKKKVSLFENDYYNGYGSSYGVGANVITQDDWMEYFESNGAVFLPCAGYRLGKKYDYSKYTSGGGYWSASDYDGIHAYNLSFDEYYLSPDSHGDDRFYGLSVRLVQDFK